MKQQHYVCQGAICKCRFGTQTDILKVYTHDKVYLNEETAEKKKAATHKELGKTLEKNSFGSCAQLNNGPCQVTLTEWKDYYPKSTIKQNDGKFLLENSKALCPVGGSFCIDITFHGQVAEITHQNIDRADEDLLNEIFPGLHMANPRIVMINNMPDHE